MRHIVLLLGMVCMLVFFGCGQGEKADQSAQGESKEAVEGVKENIGTVSEDMKEKAAATIETVKKQTDEAVEGVKENISTVSEDMKEKAAATGKTVKE